MVKGLASRETPASQLSQGQESEHESGGNESAEEGFVTVQSKKKSKKGKAFQCRGSTGKPCGKTIGKKQDSIECEGCNDWFHPSCQGLSVEAFKAIDLHDLFWVCETCRMKFKDSVSLQQVISRVEQVEKNVIEAIGKDKDEKTVEKGIEKKK